MESNKSYNVRSLVVLPQGADPHQHIVVRPPLGQSLSFRSELPDTKDSTARKSVEKSGARIPNLSTIRYLGNVAVENDEPVYAYALRPKAPLEFEQRRNYTIRTAAIVDILNAYKRSTSHLDSVDMNIIDAYLEACKTPTTPDHFDQLSDLDMQSLVQPAQSLDISKMDKVERL